MEAINSRQHLSHQGTKLQTKKKSLSMLSIDIKVTQSITQECQIFPGPSP